MGVLPGTVRTVEGILEVSSRTPRGVRNRPTEYPRTGYGILEAMALVLSYLILVQALVA